jgi:hypothetical protein
MESRAPEFFEHFIKNDKLVKIMNDYRTTKVNV